MKVAFDAQLLFEKQKTGIGRNAKMMIDHLIQQPGVTCILNCFRRRNQQQTEEVLADYERRGCIICRCRWMPGRIYNHLERIFPFPYHWLFGKSADITQFFNYTIPFGAAGKRITTVHDMAFRAYPDTVARRTRHWLDKNLKKYCMRADKILTVSKFSRREIHHYMGIPLEKIEVVYNGVDLGHYYPRRKEEIEAVKKQFDLKAPYLLYLGTLEPRKNVETLIKAYWKLKKHMPDAPKLVLAGKKGWLYDSVFESVKDFGLIRDVIFTGYVAEESVPALLSGAELFVFPSLYEGFGIPPLEAMACGTPVITSDTSSLPEVVGQAGILVSPRDGDLLAEKMAELLRNRELREHFAALGLEQAKRFTWERSAEKMMEIYRKMDREERA